MSTPTQVKPSDITAQALQLLGTPEAWCQKYWFEANLPSALSGGIPAVVSSSSPERIAETYEAGTLRSMCLDASLILAAELVYDNTRAFDAKTLDAVRERVYTALAEQHPDIMDELFEVYERANENMVKEDVQKAYVYSFLGRGRYLDDPPGALPDISGLLKFLMTRRHWQKHLSIPTLNDHSAMTYEGVRSALEKTHIELLEAGQ